AEAVDAGGGVAGVLDLLVLGALFGELPVLDLVHRHAADAHRALLAQDGDATFEVLGVGEHADVERAHGAAAPADGGDAGVFDLDVALKRSGVGHDGLDRTAEPVEQVDVVAGL